MCICDLDLGALHRVEQAETLAIRLASHKAAYEKLQHAYRAASLQVCGMIISTLRVDFYFESATETRLRLSM